MRQLAILFLFCTLIPLVFASQPEDQKFEVEAAWVCDEQGGCRLVSEFSFEFMEMFEEKSETSSVLQKPVEPENAENDKAKNRDDLN